MPRSFIGSLFFTLQRPYKMKKAAFKESPYLMKRDPYGIVRTSINEASILIFFFYNPLRAGISFNKNNFA
jgi:hypothetical protein